jgi:hypothetical protein
MNAPVILSTDNMFDPADPNHKPLDEPTRAKFAQYGYFEDQDGNFWKDGKLVTKPDGSPATVQTIKAEINKVEPNAFPVDQTVELTSTGTSTPTSPPVSQPPGIPA